MVVRVAWSGANGTNSPVDSQPSGPPNAVARWFQPAVVATGTATGGSRMPAISLPSTSTFDTKLGYTLPVGVGGSTEMIPWSNCGPQFHTLWTVIRPS